MDVHVRPMTLEDLEQVHAIDVLSFSMPWPERSFRFELTGNPVSRVWVSETPSEHGELKLVGVIVIWLILDEAHIGTFAIHPDARQQRIGQMLLAQALLKVQREGAKQAYLEVRKSNEPAITLYKKFGFEVSGVRPRYYHDNNEDALLLTLSEINPSELEKYIGTSTFSESTKDA
jgi:[ribosomal protein S18]-alanine N-acetyltransferase